MTWWFKRHPELLALECDKLESNSNYKEHARSRKNTLISGGEIIVRLNETKKFPIIIIYSESTPYSLPFVIPLKSLPSPQEIENLSLKSSGHAIKQLNENAQVEFLNFWHQNPDGTICLLEADNLEKYGEFFSVKEVINRVRDWLAGIITGKLPMDSSEVELFAHFRNKDTSKEFLIPTQFLKQDIYQGEFYCVRMSQVYTRIVGADRSIYLGSVIVGENKEGIRISPIEFKEHSYLLPEGINSYLDLLLKKKLLQQEIKRGSMIEGFWWDTQKEIKPIQNVNDFAEQVGDGNIEYGFQRIQKLIGELICMQKQDEILVGIRFMNKRNEPQWQNFVLRKGEVRHIPILFNYSTEEFKKQTINNYHLLAYRSSEFSENKYHLRNGGRVERNTLKEKAVNVIGCGALGSEFADIMGKAGIGCVNLIDYDRMKFENSIRHVLGTNSIGLYKVHGLRNHLLNHNPFVQVELGPVSVTQTPISKYFIDPGVGVSTIANDNTEGFVNEQALINNKIMFYARALRGGKAARILRVIPGKDACFYCLDLYADDGNEVFTKIPRDEQLPTITNECNNPIRPSSAADLKLISSLLSQIVLDYLQGVNQPNNHWIWSTEAIDGIPKDKINSYSLKGSNIPPHTNCPYCQPQPKLSVEISLEIISFMVQETSKVSNIETGGVLLGEISGDVLVVKHASGPGPKSDRKSMHFLKDIEYCQKYIDEMYEKNGDSAAYIGEWHYHPVGNNNPSNTDLSSLSSIANGKGYLTENPTMIIISNTGKASCTIHPARRPFYYTDLIIKEQYNEV